MAAKRPPKENVSPDNTTLNAMPDSSSEEGFEYETQTQETEVDYDENDLEELEQNVPYSRFKEVNEKAKSYKTQMSELERAYEEKLRDLTRNYETRLQVTQANKNDDYEIEYDEPSTKYVKSLEQQIQQLNQQVGSLRTTQENSAKEAKLSTLKTKYPKADLLAVKGWHIVYPEASLEDLMEKSHNDNLSLVKSSLNEIIERKKAKSRKAVPMGRSPLVIAEEDRPKNLKEASQKARAFLNGLNF